MDHRREQALGLWPETMFEPTAGGSQQREWSVRVVASLQAFRLLVTAIRVGALSAITRELSPKDAKASALVGR